MYLLSADMNATMYSRFIQPHLEEALDDTPVVLIHGPRQCGKTTLAQMVGKKKGYQYRTFDDPNLVITATEDPVGFIDRLPEKVILDEVQHVPGLFTSIKRSVDQNRKPGRFLLTGSANVLLLPRLSDSLAGRMEVLTLRPLARCEVEGRGPGLLSKLMAGDFDLVCEGRLGAGLIDHVLMGGFPEPLLRKTERRRNEWYRNYIDTSVICWKASCIMNCAARQAGAKVMSAFIISGTRISTRSILSWNNKAAALWASKSRRERRWMEGTSKA